MWHKKIGRQLTDQSSADDLFHHKTEAAPPRAQSRFLSIIIAEADGFCNRKEKKHELSHDNRRISENPRQRQRADQRRQGVRRSIGQAV
nr:MAG TPA: hypothetical protein [Caudoviricetes sp.]